MKRNSQQVDVHNLIKQCEEVHVNQLSKAILVMPHKLYTAVFLTRVIRLQDKGKKEKKEKT